MASRESINRIKIPGFKVGGIPINPEVDVYQGDLLEWDEGNHRAQSATPSSVTVIGMAETKNPIKTMGSAELGSDLTNSLVTVMQSGLVELIIQENVTLYPFDLLRVGETSAQHVKKTGATAANMVAVVDPKFARAAGKAVLSGDLVRAWLKPRPLYNLDAAASASAS